MKNFYPNTTKCIEKYNQISDKVFNGDESTTDVEDEFLLNFCLYLAQALVADTGFSEKAREELTKTADIINDVCR